MSIVSIVSLANYYCIWQASSELKTFSVDVKGKPEQSTYLDTFSMMMLHSPKYFPDQNIKYNYSSKLLATYRCNKLATSQVNSLVDNII